MLIEYHGEDDARVGFKKGDRVDVDENASFPYDFHKVTGPPPGGDNDPPAGDPPADPNPDENKEGE